MSEGGGLVTGRDEGDRPAVDRDSRWLQLLLDVALIANEAESVDAALRSALARVCQHNGWLAGFSHIGGRPHDLWWMEAGESPEAKIKAETRHLTRLWSHQVMRVGRTESVDDFASGLDTAFQLPGQAPESGGAIAVPLLVGERAVGAMVFYSRHPLSQDLGSGQVADLLQVIESIGTQMGRVVERWHLIRRIAEEAEKERESLGREIHDSLAQQLVGVKLLAQNLRKKMKETAVPYAEPWDLLVENLGQAQAQARALARGLSAGAIATNSQSLIDQLRELAEVVETGHEVSCSVDVHGSFSLPDEMARTQLFRIAREAVFNALRHADPSQIGITLRARGDEELTLEIRDDGCGLEQESSLAEGMGISGMRYRAEIVGARLELSSERGEGTVVRCIV